MGFFKKEQQPTECGCPGSAMQQFDDQESTEAQGESVSIPSELRQWPVQLMLVPPTAPYFKNSELVITADCVPFAYGNFHQDFLKDKPIVIACPKLDDLQFYVGKLTEIFKANDLKSCEVLLMEVPCCGGLAEAARAAKEQAGATFPLKVTTVGVRGENMGTKEI